MRLASASGWARFGSPVKRAGCDEAGVRSRLGAIRIAREEGWLRQGLGAEDGDRAKAIRVA
ncbi:hypothetical protein SAMN06264365_12713 [Actinoplanes regularis]|uniref:Uncharacterized protein n=1 Tax=Actinoplanes regularis TaxID=52697 RepID=A0A239I2R5_9ACTN|nr:hypothetical protein Are01nite_78790 [Actinoplanes regularis]SNS87662.1 hypothetical protein SAMN06264365_12713 [Actinoplanes regularis]